MLEVRFHGRGGQGAVLAAKMLAAAFYADGYKCQAFASYGGERRGAHVTSFLRAERGRIRARYLIYEPDCIVILDPSLIDAPETVRGAGQGAIVLANTRIAPEELAYPESLRIATIDASGIAVRNGLGTSTTPLVNTAILGAFAGISAAAGAEVSLPGVEEAVRNYVPVDVEKNIEAARQAFASVAFKG
jgi:2-oxoacid:acceptor oxidoreductase gamma subunit (pyruvate/2-ketoisovalerate family)